MDTEQKQRRVALLAAILALAALVALIVFVANLNWPGGYSSSTPATVPGMESPAESTDVPPSPKPATVAPTVAVDPETRDKVFGPVTRPADASVAVIAPEVQNAIDKGLKALAAAQGPDGGYCMSTAQRDHSEQTGPTALAGMAFLAAGDTPARGTYAANLKLIQNAMVQLPNGMLVLANKSSQAMYHHAFAMEFIANLALRTDDAATREKCRAMLQKAAALTVSAQNDAGGWRYAPKPADADTSATAAQVVSLRSAFEAGFVLDKSVPQRAANYLIGSQAADGGFGYTDNTKSALARSCAVEAALYHAGLGASPAATRGLAYLRAYFPDKPGDHADFLTTPFPYYGLFYATQVMYLQGSDWKDWYAATANDVIKHQADTGLWTDSGSDILGTAEALIMLQYPQKNLPAWLHEK